jgi:hypothetical protein
MILGLKLPYPFSRRLFVLPQRFKYERWTLFKIGCIGGKVLRISNAHHFQVPREPTFLHDLPIP